MGLAGASGIQSPKISASEARYSQSKPLRCVLCYNHSKATRVSLGEGKKWLPRNETGSSQ